VIYFICPDTNEIIGGILMLYRQVDVLNKDNFSAAVVHNNPGFRCNWFENTTRIVYSHGLQFARDDVVVIPEFHGPGIARIAPGIRKVILNQNCYLTFNNYSLDPNNRETPYLNREVIATITGSEDSASYLHYAFPQHNVYRIRYSIDRSLFHPQADKRPQIAFLPRRNYQDALQVFSILKFRGQLAGFDIRPIDKLSYRETAALMRQSAIFFSFSNIEGFGLPPAEALVSVRLYNHRLPRTRRKGVSTPRVFLSDRIRRHRRICPYCRDGAEAIPIRSCALAAAGRARLSLRREHLLAGE
jgi:hypothetical protein